MATFNLENYLENSRKVDLSEFDFSRAREHSLTPDEIRCLEYMMDVESSTIVYLRAVLRTCVIDDPTKERYAEGEPLLIFLFLAERYPEHSAWYVSWFLKQWEYVKRYCIDYTYPGWYRNAIDRSPADVQSDKGGGTKAGYHDTRALLLSLKILKRI